MKDKNKYRQRFTRTFSVDITSAVDEFRYLGKFTCKKLSISDLVTLGVRKAQLNGGMHFDANHPGMGVDSQTDEFNSMIAHLELAIVEHPNWWNLTEISDIDVIAKVFQEVISFETSFLRPKNGQAGSDSAEGNMGEREGSGAGHTQGSDNRGAYSTVVDSEVQSALEP